MNLSARRVFATAAMWLTLAALAIGGAPALFGRPALLINIRWHPDLDPAGRRYIERTLHLTQRMDEGGTVSRYALTDTSSANIRAIVTHPQVVDTHQVDRTRFLPSPGAGWTRHGGPLQRVARLLRPLTVGAGVLCVVLAVLGPLALVLARRQSQETRFSRSLPVRLAVEPGRTLAGAWTHVARFLQRGVPAVSAEAAGIFRIVFVTLVLAIAVQAPVGGGRDGWLLASGVLAIAGFMTRVTYGVFALAFLAWATVTTAHGANHATSALVITLLALLPSRWGDAISVDALIRRRAGRVAVAPAIVYGYSVWMPGFMLSVALGAAAWSKLREGTAWVANGTVRYHFLTDAHQAWVDWGPALVESDAAAVAASAAAVVTEALMITAAFSRTYWYRAAVGLACLGLFTGFALFQGVFWPGWWVLLLSFLPWHRVGRPGAAATDRPSRLPLVQQAAIALILAQQLVVSANGVEMAPLFSAYDMYSTTYTDMEDYKRKASPP